MVLTNPTYTTAGLRTNQKGVIDHYRKPANQSEASDRPLPQACEQIRSERSNTTAGLRTNQKRAIDHYPRTGQKLAEDASLWVPRREGWIHLDEEGEALAIVRHGSVRAP